MRDTAVEFDRPEVVDPHAAELRGEDPVVEAGGRPLPPEKDQGEKLILGKFKTQEDLQRAYQELEKRMGGKGEEKEQKTNNFQIDPEAKGVEEESGPLVNIEKYTDEFEADGKLSGDSLKELKKLGFSETFVEKHLQGQLALREKHESRLQEIVGDHDFEKVKAWARRSMGERELTTFNDTMNNGTTTQIELALGGVIARFEKTAAGQAPGIEGDIGAAAVTQGFKSTAEMTAAMNVRLPDGTNRYDKDEAYRQEVSRRIAMS